MKKLILTEAQTNELRRAHRAAKNKKDADKIKAVYLLDFGLIEYHRSFFSVSLPGRHRYLFNQ